MTHLARLAIALAALAATSARATSIVAVSQRGEVVIAADSLRSPVGGGRDAACKITLACGRFVAVAGWECNARHVREIVRWFACESGTEEDAAESIAMVIARDLEACLSESRSASVQVEETKRAAEVLVAGREGDVATIAVSKVRLVSKPGERLRLDFDRAEYWPGDVTVILGDVSAPAMHTADEREAIIRAIGPENAAALFVKAGIVKVPDKIGPPIDLACIDSSGAHWLSVKPGCE